MKKKLISVLLASGAFIVACDQQAANTNASSSGSTATVAAPAVKKEDAVAVVNGKYIAKSTLAELEKEIAQRSQGQTFPKEKLVEELIQRELIIQDAQQKHLETTPEVANQLEEMKKALLTQADLQNFLKTNPVTDAEIKAEYDSKVGGQNAIEYKARHILVKTEEEAKKIIADLDKKGDFAKLANKYSLDAKESQNGGDLGWFVASQMVAPFSEAVVKLEKGQYTKTPVQTQFGWHVILRDDSRPQTPPSLESVKEQLLPLLQHKKVQTMVENLRKNAKVEIMVSLEDAPKPTVNATVAPASDAPAQPAATEPAPAPASEQPAKAESAAAPATNEPVTPSTEPK
jgi:peptidyl-prolyl cis-trans isomerase C